MHDALARALAAGATVVTPNRRLARHLTDEYDRDQRAAGRRAWPAAAILPWPAWLALLESEAVASGAAPTLARLGTHATAELWKTIVEEDDEPTTDPGALASAAEQAWGLVHAFGSSGQSWRAWSAGGNEPASFARWAERYRAWLDRFGATDGALAADRVARAAGAMASWQERAVVLAGYTDTTPAEARVVAALRSAGMRIDEAPTVERAPGVPTVAGFASPDDELAAALGWARRHAEQRPDARIGIVVPDLGSRLARVHRLVRERLGAPHQAGEAPAWNVSLGPSLAAVPIVSAALDLVAVAWSSLDAGRAAALLRSRYLPGDEREGRSRVERAWLDAGVRRVRLGELIAALDARDPLAVRLMRVADLARTSRAAMRHDWVDLWREALRRAGWPGERTLSSDEHQALRALDELWSAVATIDAVAAARSHRGAAGDAAVRSLAEAAAATTFQPETPAAPIQVLGLIESIGLPFDALWIAGMGDGAWPRPPRPHPLLPIRWQRERGVPRSDAAGELAWAKRVTAQWLAAAPEVVVSHAPAPEEQVSVPSALFATAIVGTFAVAPSTARMAFDARPARERLDDRLAPPLEPGERYRAGAGLIESQSACPFQALAAMRWRADPWPATTIGLTPMERGILVHVALEALWRELRDDAGLRAALADSARIGALCDAAAREAMASVKPERWRRVPDAVRAGEGGRLARLLARWAATAEAGRSPFAVVAREAKLPLALGPLALSLRLDRVDAIDGGVAIVDYKTGEVPSLKAWLDARPKAAQLALYALAWREAHPEQAVRATVVAQVRAGEGGFAGYCADAPISADGKRQVVRRDWDAFAQRRDAAMLGLADAFARGEAAVAPRDRQECRICGRQALCRIGDADKGERA